MITVSSKNSEEKVRKSVSKEKKYSLNVKHGKWEGMICNRKQISHDIHLLDKEIRAIVKKLESLGYTGFSLTRISGKRPVGSVR